MFLQKKTLLFTFIGSKDDKETLNETNFKHEQTKTKNANT